MSNISTFHILVVDDDADVLSVSKLAMQNFKVLGTPLKIHTANSKAQAIEVIKNELTTQVGTSLLNVAFIDVVMETDSAGLELCDYIRNTIKNKTTSIYIRTGQPGIAPERVVVDRYDISGYISKVEATEDKLYTLVKSGVSQSYYTSVTLGVFQMISALITAGESRKDLAEVMYYYANAFNSANLVQYVSVDDEMIAVSPGVNRANLKEIYRKLDKLPGIPLSSSGDKYVNSQENYALIKIASSETTTETVYLTEVLTPFEEADLVLIYSFYRSLATLWKRAPSLETDNSLGN